LYNRGWKRNYYCRDTDGSDINDDGISHVKEGGLKLEVKHERISNGSFKVYAKLI